MVQHNRCLTIVSQDERAEAMPPLRMQGKRQWLGYARKHVGVAKDIEQSLEDGHRQSGDCKEGRSSRNITMRLGVRS